MQNTTTLSDKWMSSGWDESLREMIRLLRRMQSNDLLMLFYVRDWEVHGTVVSSDSHWAHQTEYDLQQAKVFTSYKRQYNDLMWQFNKQMKNRLHQNLINLTWHSVLWHLLTRQSIDQRWPLIIIFLLGDCAVLPVHLADWGGAFPGDLATVVFIKQHLIHQVGLHQVGLRRRLRGPVVVTLQSEGWEEQREEERNERIRKTHL